MKLNINMAEKKYSDIPYPEGKEARVSLFKEMLEEVSNLTVGKAKYVQLMLDILGDQVALYEDLKDEDKLLAFNWVKKNWSEDDFEYTESLVSVLLHLNFDSSRALLDQKLHQSENDKIKQLLLEAISELR